MDIPKVSCLCLTRYRIKFLHRAIHCFHKQDWPNKELVIVFDSDDKETELFLTLFADDPLIKLCKNIVIKPTVGMLRNLAIEAATGNYCIQWDDDDYHCSNRISVQMQGLIKSNKQALVLDAWLIYFEKHNAVYETGIYKYEGSIIAKRDLLLQYKYPEVTRVITASGSEIGEDTFVVKALHTRGLLASLHSPYIYFYFIHNNNTCSEQHFKNMYSSAVKSKRPMLKDQCKRLTQNLKLIDDEFLAKLRASTNPAVNALEHYVPPKKHVVITRQANMK